MTPNDALQSGNTYPLSPRSYYTMRFSEKGFSSRIHFFFVCLQDGNYHCIFIIPQMVCIKSYRKINETRLLTSNLSNKGVREWPCLSIIALNMF